MRKVENDDEKSTSAGHVKITHGIEPQKESQAASRSKWPISPYLVERQRISQLHVDYIKPFPKDDGMPANN